MIRRTKRLFGLFLAAAAAIAAASPPSLVKAQTAVGKVPLRAIAYEVTFLGTLGGKTSRALAVNNAGQVVGEAATASGSIHAFIYAKGKMKDIGSLHDGNSCAYSINASGQVVGRLGTSDTDCRVFLYSAGAIKELGTLGGPTACAYDINDAGQVVGASKTTRGVEHAFLYTRGKGMKDLGALGGAKSNSRAFTIDGDGQVLGVRSETEDHQIHAFAYTAATGMRDLGELGGERSAAHPMNLNALGGPRGFVTRTDIAGQMVGRLACVARGTEYNVVARADRIMGFEGRPGSRFPIRSIQCTLATPALNDSGQLAGYSTRPDGTTRAFLVMPDPAFILAPGGPIWGPADQPDPAPLLPDTRTQRHSGS